MLQKPNLLSLMTTITFMFWSWFGTLTNGVVSDPQASLVNKGCTPSGIIVVSNSSVLNAGINSTFGDIRKQIVTENKYFVTAQQGNDENSVNSLFQCRNYLSIHDCVSCFDVAAVQTRNCPVPGGHVVYDGCFLRYNTTPPPSLFLEKPIPCSS